MMSLKKLLNLEIIGGYCVRKISKNSLVLVAVSPRKNTGELPAKIGHYVVSGVEYLYGGRLGSKFSALSEDAKVWVKKKIDGYRQLYLSDLSILPETVEYVGYCSLIGSNNDKISIPSHIRYIDYINLDKYVKQLSFPDGFMYLGKIDENNMLSSIIFGVARTQGEPRNSLSLYIPYEKDNTPRIAEGALCDCKYINSITLYENTLKLAKNSLPKYRVETNGESIYVKKYKLKIPYGYELDENNDYRGAILEGLEYPRNIAESARSKSLGFAGVERLAISDTGCLEEYLKLLKEGKDPEEYPEKCLYQLLRVANRVVFKKPLEKIFDGMFSGCDRLQSLWVSEHMCLSTEVDLSTCTEVGDRAFYGCTSVKNLKLKMGVIKKIGKEAFANSGLEYLDLPIGITTLGDRAFCDCKSLRRMYIYPVISDFGSNVFSGCERLVLTPHNRRMLENYPKAYEEIKAEQDKIVSEILLKSRELVEKNPRAYSSFHDAFDLCFKALNKDSQSREAIEQMSRLILNKDFGICLAYSKILDVRKYLVAEQSSELVALLDKTVDKLKAMCDKIRNPKKIDTLRACYGRNCDLESAIGLCEFFLNLKKKHPNITVGAQNELKRILSLLVLTETCSHTADLDKKMADIKSRVEKEVGFSDVSGTYCVAMELQSSRMISKVERAISSCNKEGEMAYCDAEMWFEVAHALNKNVKIPTSLSNYRKNPKEKVAKKALKSEPAQKTVSGYYNLEIPTFSQTPYTPLIPDYTSIVNTYSASSSYEISSEADEIVSEYWANVARMAEQNLNGSFTYDDIESEWALLGEMGFWDDKSWM